MINPLFPNSLKKGDTIGVVSPSLPIIPLFEKNYELGKQELISMGFDVLEAKNCKRVKWWSGGTPKERADDINAMFSDPSVKAIIAQNGGNSAFTVLEHLDFNLVRDNPKPFIGFSDITNFHSAFYTKTGLIGFHMGLLTYSLGWIWNNQMRNQKNIAKSFFKTVLTDTKPLRKIEPVTSWESWRDGEAEGILFGGNLSMLGTLLGTEYFPELKHLKGAVLFWEIDNTDLYRIERGLTQLKYSGLLNVISGMIIGKLPDLKTLLFEGIVHPTPKELVLDVLNEYKFPILAEVDFGHKNVNIPVPIGSLAAMNSTNKTIDFKQSFVK